MRLLRLYSLVVQPDKFCGKNVNTIFEYLRDRLCTGQLSNKSKTVLFYFVILYLISDNNH